MTIPIPKYLDALQVTATTTTPLNNATVITIAVCMKCGSAVINTTIHDQWHTDLNGLGKVVRT